MLTVGIQVGLGSGSVGFEPNPFSAGRVADSPQRAARRRRGYVLTGAFAADMVGNSFFVGMADEEHSEIAAIAGSDRRGFGLPRSRRNGLSGGAQERR